jgi:hypothetical protein
VLCCAFCDWKKQEGIKAGVEGKMNSQAICESHTVRKMTTKTFDARARSTLVEMWVFPLGARVPPLFETSSKLLSVQLREQALHLEIGDPSA